MVFRERCHANMIWVGVALYFSASDTINGSLRTTEYPANFGMSIKTTGGALSFIRNARI
jgi:hypothetical protein